MQSIAKPSENLKTWPVSMPKGLLRLARPPASLPGHAPEIDLDQLDSLLNRHAHALKSALPPRRCDRDTPRPCPVHLATNDSAAPGPLNSLKWSPSATTAVFNGKILALIMPLSQIDPILLLQTAVNLRKPTQNTTLGASGISMSKAETKSTSRLWQLLPKCCSPVTASKSRAEVTVSACAS